VTNLLGSASHLHTDSSSGSKYVTADVRSLHREKSVCVSVKVLSGWDRTIINLLFAQPQQVSSVKGGSMDHQEQQHESRRMELLTEPHLGQFTYFLNWKSVLMKAADQRPKH